MIECLVCGKTMKVVSNTHLATHQMTTKGYLDIFPGAETHSKEYRKACSKAHKGVKFPTWEEKYGPQELEKMRSIYRDAMLERLSNGTIKKTRTKPHRMMSKALKQAFGSRYRFQEEFLVKYYSIDLACPERMVAVEVDGDFFHNKDGRSLEELSDIQKKNAWKDKAKEKFLTRMGWKLIRVWESDVLEDIEGAVQRIADAFDEGSIEKFDYSQVFESPRVCAVCGGKLTAKQIIAGYHHCSRECGYQSRRKVVVSKCKECGVRIEYRKKRSFCGVQCQKKFEARDAKRRVAMATPKIINSEYHRGLREKSRVSLVCPCGAKFWKHRCRLTNKYVDCCSIECRSKYKILKGPEHEVK